MDENLEIVEITLRNGADTSLGTIKDLTTADLAKRRGHSAVAELIENTVVPSRGAGIPTEGQ